MILKPKLEGKHVGFMCVYIYIYIHTYICICIYVYNMGCIIQLTGIPPAPNTCRALKPYSGLWRCALSKLRSYTLARWSWMRWIFCRLQPAQCQVKRLSVPFSGPRRRPQTLYMKSLLLPRQAVASRTGVAFSKAHVAISTAQRRTSWRKLTSLGIISFWIVGKEPS